MERKIIKENNFKALLPKNIKCCIEEYKNKKDNILYHIHDQKRELMKDQVINI